MGVFSGYFNTQSVLEPKCFYGMYHICFLVKNIQNSKKRRQNRKLHPENTLFTRRTHSSPGEHTPRLRQLNPGVAARFLSDVRVYVRLCDQLAHVKSRPNAFSSFVDDPNHHGPAAAITISKWASRYGKRDCDDPLHEPMLALHNGIVLVPTHMYAVIRSFRRERKRLRIA